jgi:hypothetical protein
MELIGLDPGFGAYKVGLWTPEGIKTAIVPAQVGIGRTEPDMLSVRGITRTRTRFKRPIKVQFGPRIYLVGEGVEYETEPIHRIDLRRLSQGPEAQALFYAAVGSILPPGETKAKIQVGLPVEVMISKPAAVEMMNQMRSWMVGEHRFSVDDAEYHLIVEEVLGSPQGAAAYFDWLLDDKGKLARDQSVLYNLAGVCDIGFRTVNFFVVSHGEVIKKFTGGNDLGVKTAAETLVTLVKERYGIELSLPRADGFLREPTKKLTVFGKEVSLQDLVTEALDGTFSRIISYMDRLWGMGEEFSPLLLCGGGAKLFEASILGHYPHAQVLPDPIFANARGLTKIAARRWLK